jgi:DNA-binding transcriptional LysR family regulator
MKTTIDDLKLFMRIVELRSLRQVALELRTEPSTVTRRLVSLEQRLGVKLIQRSRNESQTTEEGEIYYRHLVSILDQLDEAEALLGQSLEKPRGLLRISCPVDLGVKYISQWITQFQHNCPELQVELLLNDQFVDLTESGVDIAIRIGELADSSYKARFLGNMQMALVGSKEYFSEHAVPVNPTELEKHTFVVYSWLSSPSSFILSDGLKTTKVRMNSKLAINNLGAIIQAVGQGAGLHLGPVWYLNEFLEDGSLYQVLPNYSLPKYPVHALYKSTSTGHVPAKIRAAIDMLVAKVSKIKGVTYP